MRCALHSPCVSASASSSRPSSDPDLTVGRSEIAASYALMQLSTMVGAVEPDALQLFVRLMHEKKANVELVEYMMAGMWILLRTDSNRAFLLNTIDEQRRASTTDGDGNPYATTSGAPLLGEIDQQLELSAAVQESEASIQKAEKMLQSAEASFQSGAVKSGGSVRSIQAKRTAENSAVEIAPEDSRGLKSVKEEGEEEEGEGGEEDKKEGAVDTALNMGTAMATGGHGEWGLQIILDVGFTWLDKLKVVGSEGDEDAPLVKLFEFLVSGLGLLMTDTDVVPRSHDQDVFEAVEYPRGKPLYEDPRGFKTRRQLAEEMRGSTVGFVGMAVRPPDGMEELTEVT